MKSIESFSGLLSLSMQSHLEMMHQLIESKSGGSKKSYEKSWTMGVWFFSSNKETDSKYSIIDFKYVNSSLINITI